MADQAITRPLLLGHRGARGIRSIPENTMASFDRALADGCHGFEFDVRLTADGEAVICHDPFHEGVEIARASRQALQLARLEDVLGRYGQRAFLDIELKVAGLEEIVRDLCRKSAPTPGFVVSSFLPEVLRVLEGEFPLGLICETREELGGWSKVPVDYVIAHYRLVGDALVRELRGARKKIMVWTVNDPREMLRFRDMGVDGIVSDDPGLLKRTVSAKTAEA